jgi:hypothetical protein
VLRNAKRNVSIKPIGILNWPEGTEIMGFIAEFDPKNGYFSRRERCFGQRIQRTLLAKKETLIAETIILCDIADTLGTAVAPGPRGCA